MGDITSPNFEELRRELGVVSDRQEEIWRDTNAKYASLHDVILQATQRALASAALAESAAQKAEAASRQASDVNGNLKKMLDKEDGTQRLIRRLRRQVRNITKQDEEEKTRWQKLWERVSWWGFLIYRITMTLSAMSFLVWLFFINPEAAKFVGTWIWRLIP